MPRHEIEKNCHEIHGKITSTLDDDENDADAVEYNNEKRSGSDDDGADTVDVTN